MNDIPQTERAVQLVGPDKLELNSAKPVADPGPHQVLAQSRGGRPVLLRPQAAQAVLAAQPQVRRPDRPRRAGAGGNAELRAGRRADRSRPRGGHPRRQGRAGRRPLQDRRAVHRRDRLPLAADRQVQRRLRLQFRGRVAGIRAARRTGHHLARRRVDADPGARGSVGLGAGAGRAVGLRRERLHRSPAADAEARRPAARGRRRCRRPRRGRQDALGGPASVVFATGEPSPRSGTRASTTSSISAPTPRRRRNCLRNSPPAACWRSSRAAASSAGRSRRRSAASITAASASSEPPAPIRRRLMPRFRRAPRSARATRSTSSARRGRWGRCTSSATCVRAHEGVTVYAGDLNDERLAGLARSLRRWPTKNGVTLRTYNPSKDPPERRLRLHRADGARPRPGRRRPSRRRRRTRSSTSSPASRPTRRPPSISTPISRSSSISSAPAARS